MKIAYVASFGNTFFNGVFRKIDSQLSVWRALPGVEVETFFRAVEGVDVLGGKAYRINWPPAFAYSAGFIRGIRHFSPDMIYLRHEICGPQMMELVRAFSGKVALEINADLDAELRLEARHSLKRRAAYLVNSVTSGYLEKHLGACVCVSSDFLPFSPMFLMTVKWSPPTVSIWTSIRCASGQQRLTVRAPRCCLWELPIRYGMG